MSFSRRYLPAVLLVLLSLTASLSAQTTTKQNTKTARGSVSGRVTIKGKGATGVALGMRKSDPSTPFESFLKAVTDQDGFYRISNVAAGSYEVTVSEPAYILADAGNARAKTVVVGEDESIDDLNFSLVRGGVITGKVTDADGRPAIQQQVNLYRSDAFEQQSPQRPAFAATNVQTDDRGIYRMFGLTPGRYKVSAGRGDDMFPSTFPPARTTYKQVFHPDVTDQAKATIIEVSEGSEANNVDIMLGRAQQTFSASGRVVDAEKGLPVPNIRFGLQRSVGQRAEFINNIVSANAQGDFIVEGLIPGKYGIFLLPNQPNDMRAEAFTFDIIDQDVSGVTIKLTKGASVSGIVIMDSEDKAAYTQLLQMQVRAFVLVTAGTAGFGNSSSSPISPDGSFRLTGLPGGTVNMMLGGSMGMPMKGFNISRVERDGVASTRGIEVKEGEQVTGVRVIVSYGNGTLRGVVKLENGTLPETGRILIRLTKPGEPMSNLRPPPVDARGHFLMDGIPPGVYELIATVTGAGPGAPRMAKREVSVQDGVIADVEITVDLSAPPKP